jgi:hypothetical protein
LAGWRETPLHGLGFLAGFYVTMILVFVDHPRVRFCTAAGAKVSPWWAFPECLFALVVPVMEGNAWVASKVWHGFFKAKHHCLQTVRERPSLKIWIALRAPAFASDLLREIPAWRSSLLRRRVNCAFRY